METPSRSAAKKSVRVLTGPMTWPGMYTSGRIPGLPPVKAIVFCAGARSTLMSATSGPRTAPTTTRRFGATATDFVAPSSHFSDFLNSVFLFSGIVRVAHLPSFVITLRLRKTKAGGGGGRVEGVKFSIFLGAF